MAQTYYGLAMTEWKTVVVAIVKNEAPYIVEWMLHHLALGADHFVIYDNGSSDGTQERITKFINAGAATLISWPMRGGQIDAYNHAITFLRHSARWVGFLDIDEFVVLHNDTSLPAFLDGCDADQILIPWRTFTHGGHAVTPGGNTTDNYFWTYRVKEDTPVQVKHFVRPGVVDLVAVHCSVTPRARIKIADGNPGRQTHVIYGPSYKGAQINHYSTRSHMENQERLRKGQVSGRAFKQVEEFRPLTDDLMSHLDYDDSILRHRQQYVLQEQFWNKVAEFPHRFGLWQPTVVLPSWNDVLYSFCISFGNYLTKEMSIKATSSFKFMQIGPSGESRDIFGSLLGREISSITFGVKINGLTPHFQGSVHYGDFTRRFSFKCVAIHRGMVVTSYWYLEAAVNETAIFVYFDIMVDDDTTVALSSVVDGEVLVQETVYPGRFAGAFYVPNYLKGPVRLSAAGKATFRELVLGTLP
jgi:hypothetical protein